MNCLFYQEGERIKLTVDNPCLYPFWYTLWKGSETIAQGYVSTLDLSIKNDKKENYYVRIMYLFGGKEQVLTNEIIRRNKEINIDIHTPNTVYPGMKTILELELTDNQGAPVKDADVTAVAVTSKFNATEPFVPYFGPIRTDKKRIQQINVQNKQIGVLPARIRWNQWKTRIGLDTLEYYKFLHPDPIYSITEDCPENITQLSPYVIIDGEIQQVHM